jgi:nucleotide-binding universal stress UspA family protein
MQALETNATSNNLDFAAPEHILLATDINDLDYLLPHALAQCQACAASLLIVHVIQEKNSGALDEAVALIARSSLVSSHEHLQRARARLRAAATQVRSAGIECLTMIRFGHTYPVIEKIVQHAHIGRVILGTHARSQVSNFFLGSTAHQILTSVRVPVLTIGPHAHPDVQRAPGRILHPVSLNQGYREAARLAIEIGQFYGSQIRFLHILPPLGVPSERNRLRRWANSELDCLIREEIPQWMGPTVTLEEGDIVEEIACAADRFAADLIVMGANPESVFRPVYGDKTVNNVIAQARCPVLTLLHSTRSIVNPAKPRSTVLI